jgi:hypothetical protein
MKQNPPFETIFAVMAVVWAALGFFQFRYPEFFARINERFRIKWVHQRFGITQLSGSTHTSFTRGVGICYMVLAALVLTILLIRKAFGLA